MSGNDWQENVGVWLAIVTGIVTGMGTVFAMWREWQQFRQNQVVRLTNAAIVAVRRTEASIVRPLLMVRMTEAVNRFVHDHEGMDPNRFRSLLFSELYTVLRLSEDEKKLAKQTAENHLLALLRTMPSPPLRVKSDAQLKRNLHAVAEEVETAYSARPRPGVELLMQMAQFCGNALVTN
jgi:hypothetical protein